MQDWWQQPEIQDYYVNLKSKLGYTPPANPYIGKKAAEEEDSDEDVDMKSKKKPKGLIINTIFFSLSKSHLQYLLCKI